VAPPQLEDVYTLEDALVVGCLLITLLKHADRVKMACLAQLVNVIAPIMTQNGGKAWAQPTFYPFMDASLLGRGTVMTPVLECPTYKTGYGEASFVETVGVYNEEKGEFTVFAVNRNLEGETELNIDLSDFADFVPAEYRLLTGKDLKAVNTADAPENVVPTSAPLPNTEGHRVKVSLPAASWNVLRFVKK